MNNKKIYLCFYDRLQRIDTRVWECTDPRKQFLCWRQEDDVGWLIFRKNQAVEEYRIMSQEWIYVWSPNIDERKLSENIQMMTHLIYRRVVMTFDLYTPIILVFLWHSFAVLVVMAEYLFVDYKIIKLEYMNLYLFITGCSQASMAHKSDG